jgi:hypothetical protein
MTGLRIGRMALASAGTAALFASTLAFMPAGAAAKTSPQKEKSSKPPCAVTANPATFTDQGEGDITSSVATIVEVECNPVYAEDEVTIDSNELYSACDGNLSWDSDPFLEEGDWTWSEGSTTYAYLDDDGNATAVAWGGPSCAPTRVDIYASLDAPPYYTAMTTFTIQAPHSTKHGVFVTPAKYVEDATYSSAATIIQVEFPSYDSEQEVTINADEFYSRCEDIEWYGPDEDYYAGDQPNVNVTLDNDGNAFVVLLGYGCASGPSTISADIDIAPYTTYNATFTVLSPRPTAR